MRASTASALLSLATTSIAWPPGRHDGAPWHRGKPNHAQQKWNLKDFTSMVVFGDSYTDDSRLGYFISNDGEAPPVGYENPVNYNAATGGRVWAQYVGQYSGANIYNYAVSGAVCSNDITPRYFSAIDAPFPDIDGYELPAYLADSDYVYDNGTKFLIDPPDETVYAIWIGTNDLGANALIQDEQVPGTNLTTYVDCVYNQLSRLYDNGGRYFVIMNNAPLNLAPEYAPADKGGVGNNQFWADKESVAGGNITYISEKMLEQVVTVNSIFDYRTPFEVKIAEDYPGASFAVYDVHDLMTNIYYDPSEYLNGTAPLNVTGYVHQCNSTGGDCITADNPDSFLWYDELHPSEQTERVIAREFVAVVNGDSQYATYWSS